MSVWEIGIVATLLTLGVWLKVPVLMLGVFAVATATINVGFAIRLGRPAFVGISVLSLLASAAAVDTSRRVKAVETGWEVVNENLIQRASRELESALGEAVELVEALAERGAALPDIPRSDAFGLLEGGLAGRSPERGVVVFDGDGNPWVWAGRMRLTVEPRQSGLRSRITPFYVVIEAERRVGNRVAIGQVVLSADSSIPDRDLTVARRFARATGSGLQFYDPDNAPSSADVFDYCMPGCTDVTAPDTLFSVRAVPPRQGEFKLELIDRGGRRVALAVALSLAALIGVGRLWLRWLGVLGVGVLLISTPLAVRLGLGGFFSPQRYYLQVGAWISASAGTLFVLGAICIMVVAARWSRPGGPRVAALLPALFIGITAPFLLQTLAMGVTLSGSGTGVSTWLGWTTALAMSVTGLTLVGARAARLSGLRPPPSWTLWVVCGGTLVASLTGLAVWRPAVGWPFWYSVLWVPLFVGALLPARRIRVLIGSAVVSAAAATVLTWGAVANGRVEFANRDVSVLIFGVDPFADRYLERLGTDLQTRAVPQSAAQLYAGWQRSQLAPDYPVVLSSWTTGLERIAHVELAELGVSDSTTRAVVADVINEHEPRITPIAGLPGAHYILAVPFPGGDVVTVTLGPRSRSIEEHRVARFLRGDANSDVAHELTISDRRLVGSAPPILTWRREGFVVRGEQSFTALGVLPDTGAAVEEGEQHMRVEVSIGGSASALVIRGALLAIVTVLVAALLWWFGEMLRGRFPWRPLVRGIQPRSYRAQLTGVLGVFVIGPTLIFAVWSVSRIGAEVARTRDVVLEQSLRDAASGFDFSNPARSIALDSLARQFNTDLILYEDGVLAGASEPVLTELGLIEAYLAPRLFRLLAIEGGLEAIADRNIAGRPIRVAYRSLSGVGGRSVVLSAARLIDVRGSTEAFAVILAVALGLAAAAGMASRAARMLARPVQELRAAAGAVGQGNALPAFAPDTLPEFAPVVKAFQRMASDVQSHQEALQRALKFTEAILSNVATGVVALDRHMRVTTANPRAIALIGKKPDPNRALPDEVGGEWVPVWVWVQEFLTTGESVDAREFTVGKVRVRVQVAALTSADGGVVLALDDATELAMAERILAWGEMARQVAHEIKNPLTPIRLGIQHLQRAYRDPRGDFDETLDRTSQQILDEIERLDAIARAFSRFGAPPAEASPLERVDVAKVAKETVSLYSMGGGTDVALIARAPIMGRVRADELKEVLVNLIENARGAGATHVSVEVNKNDGHPAQFCVRDDGNGIPSENVSRIFEPQFSTNTSGTGLGLAICKRLVESWGGRIQVESVVGQGTTMTFNVG